MYVYITCNVRKWIIIIIIRNIKKYTELVSYTQFSFIRGHSVDRLFKRLSAEFPTILDSFSVGLVNGTTND